MLLIKLMGEKLNLHYEIITLQDSLTNGVLSQQSHHQNIHMKRTSGHVQLLPLFFE